MLLRLSIYRVARGIGRALGQLQLEITFDGVQRDFLWSGAEVGSPSDPNTQMENLRKNTQKILTKTLCTR